MPIISGGSGGAAGSMSRVCDLTLSGAQASFDTNTILGGNIPTTFAYLQLYLYGRSDAAATAVAVSMTVNNDGGSLYDYEQIQETGGTVSGSHHVTQPSAQVGFITGNTATANAYGAVGLVFLNSRGTTGWKPYLATSVDIGATQQLTVMGNGQYESTSAVTRIAVVPGSGSFMAGSRFSLYGIT